jgi:hypothetical protein
MLFQGLGQDTLEGFVVAVLLEQRQARDCPVEGVIDKATGGHTRGSRHGPEVNSGRWTCQVEKRCGVRQQ